MEGSKQHSSTLGCEDNSCLILSDMILPLHMTSMSLYLSIDDNSFLAMYFLRCVTVAREEQRMNLRLRLGWRTDESGLLRLSPLAPVVPDLNSRRRLT